MTITRRSLFVLAALVTGLAGAPAVHAQTPSTGILLLAHGGRAEWNDRVTALAASIDADQPVEVAFGMATRPNIQAAVDRLVARKVTRIVAVPLFISSHSSVVTSTAYLLRLRKDMPKDLAMFARMSHGPQGHAAPAAGAPATAAAPATDPHAGHHGAAAAAVDGTTPIVTPVPVTMTAALDAHPLVGEIIAARAAALSSAPASEAIVIVAHGPVTDADNNRWLANMAVIAQQVSTTKPYAAVEYLTVRDDAPKPQRDAATAEFRALVQKHLTGGHRVLIVPLLLSFGGIEQGVRKRLDGLDYTMADRGLMPDERLAQWVRTVAAAQN
ncbi:MAG TPA: CbiX/SirB N-terminal domain-containing protein [Luteitalea sp.]|nr:CbiX/SirB N-terminal domain-containing protein [Luteitalea sp.]